MRRIYDDRCEWIVNIPYALISSTVSFWLPCGIMLSAYYKIYREAIKQEKFIYRTQQMANQSNHHLLNKNNRHHNNSHLHSNNNNNNNNPNDDDDDVNGVGGVSGGGSGGVVIGDCTSKLNAPKYSSASENNVIQVLN